MTLRRVPAFAFAVIAVIGFGVQAEAGAQAEATGPCQELIRLRNAANEVWKQAMSVPPSERCRALGRASSATEATLNFANRNHDSCNISDRLLSQVEGYHREAVQARDNVCAGRPVRPYPAEIIQR